MKRTYLSIIMALILILLSACGSKEKMDILVSEPEGDNYSYTFESEDNVLSNITVPASVQFNYEDLKDSKITFEFSGETTEGEEVEAEWEANADLAESEGTFDVYNSVKHLIEIDGYDDGYKHFKAGEYEIVAKNENTVIAEGKFEIEEGTNLATDEKGYTEQELKAALKEDGLLDEYERQEKMEALEVQDPAEIDFNELASYAGDWKDENGKFAFRIAFHEDGTGERTFIMTHLDNAEVESSFQVVQLNNNELILNEEGRFLEVIKEDGTLKIEGENEVGVVFTYTR